MAGDQNRRRVGVQKKRRHESPCLPSRHHEGHHAGAILVESHPCAFQCALVC